MVYQPSDPSLQAAQGEMDERLRSNTRTQDSDLMKLMGRYGSPMDPEFLKQMQGMHREGEDRSRRRFGAGMVEAQLRSDIHKRKLAELKKQWKAEDKADRNAMWASILGSVATVGSGVYGAATAPSAPPSGTYQGSLSSFYQQPQNYQSGFQQVPEWYTSMRR